MSVTQARTRRRRIDVAGIVVVIALAVSLWQLSRPGRVHTHLVATAPPPPAVARFIGSDRVATAIAVAQVTFPSRASGVVLARSETFADALAAAPLAASVGGPLLLTSSSSLDPRVRAEILRILPHGGRVDIVGGEGAVSAAVARTLSGLGYHVTRLWGTDRDRTAVQVANASSPDPRMVLLATGADFPDGLVAGAAAVHRHGVVLLTDGPVMPTVTRVWLAAHPRVPVYAIGGAAARAAADSRTRAAVAVVGPSRYATAVQVAQLLFTSPPTVGLASGVNFPDALVAGARLGRVGAPLVLTDPAGLSSPPHDYLDAMHPRPARVELYGGARALAPTIDDQVAALAVN